MFSRTLAHPSIALAAASFLHKLAHTDSSTTENKTKSLTPYNPTDSWFSPAMNTRHIWNVAGSIWAVGAGFTLTNPTAIAATLGMVGAVGLPIIFGTAAIGCMAKAYFTHNYDSSTEVAKYREECKNLSLEKAIMKHGKHIFFRLLLSPKEVEQKYLEKEKTLSTIPEICSFYLSMETLRKAADPENRYTFPVPARLQKEFQEKCRFLSFADIEETHGLDALITWKLLSQEELTEKYVHHANCLFAEKGLGAVIIQYKKMQDTQKAHPSEGSYEIPHPSAFADRWKQQIQNASLNDVDYTVSDLLEYGIIKSDSQAQELKIILENKANIYTTHRNDLTLLDEKCKQKASLAEKQLSIANNSYNTAITALYGERQRVRNHIASLERLIQEAENLGKSTYSLKVELEAAKWSLRFDHFTGFCSEIDLNNKLSSAKTIYKDILNEIENDRKETKSKIDRIKDLDLEKLEPKFTQFKKTIL